MLKSAFPYKDIFSKLNIHDPNFKIDLPNGEKWKFVAIVCNKLDVFHSMTKVIFW